MVCDQCLVLRDEAEAKDQIIKELNTKLTKQKLQYKAQVAQLKQSITEDEKFSRIATMAIGFEDSENEAILNRRQIEELQQIITAKDLQLRDHQIKIKNLEDQMNRNGDVGEKSLESAHSEVEQTEDLQQELKRMYAQMVYKDSRILELNRVIDEKDNVIMDLQESLNEKNEVIRSKLRAVQILQEQMSKAESALDGLMEKSQGLANTVFDVENEMTQLSSSLHLENLNESVGGVDGDAKLNQKIGRLINHVLSLETRQQTNGDSPVAQQQSPPEQQQLQQKKKKRVTFDLSDIDKQTQIDSLRESVRNSEKIADALRLENEHLRAELADVHIDFVPLERHRQELEALNFQVGVNYSQAQKLVEQLEETNREWQNKLLKLKAQHQLRINELEEQLESYRSSGKTSVADAEVLVDLTSEDLANWKSRCSSLEETIEQMDKQRNEDRTDRDRMVERLAQLEEDYKVVCRDCDFFGRQRVDMLDEQSRMRSELDNRQVKLEILERSSDDLAKERERLKDKCYKLESEVADLEFEMAQVYEENKTLDTENQSLLDRIKEFELSVEQLTQNNATMRDTMESTMRGTLNDLESQWQLKMETQQRDFDKESGDFRLRAKAHDAKIRSLEKELQDQGEIMDKTTLERNQLKEKLEVLMRQQQEERESRMNRESKLQDELTQVQSKLEFVSRENESLHVVNTQLQQKLVVAENDVDYFRDELTSATEELRNTKSSATSLGDELAEVKSIKQTLVEEKDDIENELETLWTNESQLKKHLAEVESLNQQLMTSCGELQSRCNLLEQEEKENQGKIQRLLGESAKLTKLKLMLTDEIELLKSSSTEQQKSLATTLVDYKGRLADLESQIDDLTSSLTKERSANRELSEDRRDKLDEIAQLKGKLSDQQFQFEMRLGEKSDVCEQLQKSIAELQAALTSVKNSLNLERTAKSELEVQLNQLNTSHNEEVSSLNNQLTDAKKSLRDWQAHLKKIAHQLKTLNEERSELGTLLRKSETDLTQMSTVIAGRIEKEISSIVSAANSRQNLHLESLQQTLTLEKQEVASQYEFLLQQHQKSLDNLRARQDELLSTIALKDSKLVQLQGEKSELTARLRQLQTENLQLQQQSEAADSSTKTDELRDLQKQIQLLHGDNKRLLDSLEAILNDKKKLTEERQNLCKEIVNLNSFLTESNNNREAQQIAIVGLNDSIDNLIKENESLQAALNEQTLRLANSKVEVEKYEDLEEVQTEVHSQSLQSTSDSDGQRQFESQLEETQAELQHLIQVNEVLQGERQTMGTRIDQLRLDVEDEKRQAQEYHSRWEESKQLCEDLRDQLELIKSEMTTKDDQLDQTRKELENLSAVQQSLDSTQAYVDELKMENSKLIESEKATQSLLELQQQQNAKLQTDVDSLKEEINENQRKFDTVRHQLNEETAALHSREAELKLQFQMLHDQLTGNEQHVDSQQLQLIEELQTKLTEMKMGKDQVESAYQQLTEYYNTAKESYSQLYEQFQVAVGESAQLSEKLTSLEAESEEQKTLMTTVKNDLVKVLEEKATTDRQLIDLREQLDSLRDTKDHLEKQLDAKQADFDRLHNSNSAEVQSLMKQLQENSVDKAEFLALQSSEKDKTDWRQKCAELTVQLEESQRRGHTDSVALAEEKEVGAALQSELREVKVLLKERTIELQRLEEDEKLLKEQLGIINESLIKMSSECERLEEELHQSDALKREFQTLTEELQVAKEFKILLDQCRLELASVKEDLAKQLGVYGDLKCNLDAKQSEVDQLEAECAAQHRFVEEKSAEVKSCRFLIEELEAGLSYSEEEKGKFLEELNIAKQQLANKTTVEMVESICQTETDPTGDLERKLTEAQQVIKEFEHRLLQEFQCRTEMGKQFEDLAKEKYQVAEELLKAKDDLKATVEVRNGAFEKLKSQRLELDSLRQQLDGIKELESKLVQLQLDFDQKSTQQEETEAELQRVVDYNNLLKTEIDDLQLQIVKKTERGELLEQRHQEFVSKIARLEEELKAERLTNEQLVEESSSHDVQSVVDDLQQTVASLLEEKSLLSEQLDSLKTQLKTAETTAAQLQAEKKTTEELYQTAVANAKELEMARDQLQIGYTQLTEYYTTLKDSYAQLYDQYQTGSVEMDRLKLSLNDMEKLKEEQQSQLEAIKQELVEKQWAVDSSAEKCLQVEAELYSCQEKLILKTSEIETAEQEKIDLKTQLDHLQSQCDNLQKLLDERNQLEAEKNELNERITQMETLLNSKEKQLIAADEKLIEMKSQWDELGGIESVRTQLDGVTELEAKCCQLQTFIDQKSLQHEEVQSELQRLVDDNSHLSLDIEALQLQIAEKNSSIEGLNQNLADAESIAAHLQSQLTERKDLTAQFEEELKAEREKRDDLALTKSSIEDNQAAVDDLLKTVASLEEEKSSLSEELVALKSRLQTADERSAQLQVDHKNIEELYQTAVESAKELESTRDRLQVDYTQVTEYYTTLKDSYAQLYEQFQASTVEMDRLKLSLGDMEKLKEKQQSQLEAIKQELIDTQAAVDSTGAKSLQIEAELHSCQEKLMLKTSELETSEEEKIDLKTQVDQLQSHYDSLQKLLDERSQSDFEAERNELDERIAQMETTLKAKEKQLIEVEGKLTEMKSERDDFEDEFRSAFGELELKEAECKCLREEVAYIRHRSDNLQTSLDAAEENCKRLTAEQLRLKETSKELERQCGELTNRWSQLERIVVTGADTVGLQIDPQQQWDVFANVNLIVEYLHQSRVEIEQLRRDQLALQSKTEEIVRQSANDSEERYRQEWVSMRQQIDDWRSKCGHYQNEIGYLKETVEKQHEELQAAKSELSQLHSYKSAATETIQLGEAVKEELRLTNVKYNELVENFQSLSSQSDSWESLMASLKSERDQLHFELERLKKDLDERQHQFSTDESIHVAHQQQLESASGELITVRRQLVESRQLYDAAKLELSQMRGVLEELSQSKEADLVALRQENSGLMEKLSLMGRKLNSMELKIVERDVLSERLQQAELQLERLATEKRELTKQTGQFHDQIRIQMEERRHLKAENDQMRVKLESVNSLDEKLKFTESQLAMFLARNAELERDANDKSTRCDQLERRLADVLGGSSNSLSLNMDERETAVLMPDSLESSADFFTRFSLARPTALFSSQHRYLLQRLRTLRRLPYFTHLTRLLFICYVVGIHFLAVMAFVR